jgi:hypothetical protein
MREGVLVLDPQGWVAGLNPAAQKIFGATACSTAKRRLLGRSPPRFCRSKINLRGVRTGRAPARFRQLAASASPWRFRSRTGLMAARSPGQRPISAPSRMTVQQVTAACRSKAILAAARLQAVARTNARTVVGGPNTRSIAARSSEAEGSASAPQAWPHHRLPGAGGCSQQPLPEAPAAGLNHRQSRDGWRPLDAGIGSMPLA